MRRLLGLSAGLLLLVSLIGCTNSASGQQPAAAAGSGQAASQNTTADPPSTDISDEPSDDKSGTPMELHGSRGDDMEDRTGRAKAEVPASKDRDTTSPPPAIEEVERYLKGIIYPNSLFTTKEGNVSNNGKVVIAMTKATSTPSQVQQHFESKGAKTIDQRTENGQTDITMELLDTRAGVKVAISISTALSAASDCLVNYAANAIPRESGGASKSNDTGGGLQLNPDTGNTPGENAPGNTRPL